MGQRALSHERSRFEALNLYYAVKVEALLGICEAVSAAASYLMGRHKYVDHAEVLFQAMPHKNASQIGQVAQLQVRRLQGCEVVLAHRGVQVSRLESAVLSEVVKDWLCGTDVIIHAGLPCLWILSPDNGHPGKPKPRWHCLNFHTPEAIMVSGIGKHIGLHIAFEEGCIGLLHWLDT